MNELPFLAQCPSKHNWCVCKTRIQGWKAFLALILFQAVFHAIPFNASEFLIQLPQNWKLIWLRLMSPFFLFVFFFWELCQIITSPKWELSYIPVGTISITCHMIVKYKYELSVCINGLVPQTSEFLTFTSSFSLFILLICIPNTADDTSKIYFSRIWSAPY